MMVKILEELPIFPIVFSAFPKNSASVPSPSTDNGTSKSIDVLVKFQVTKKVQLIFFVYQRGL